MVAHMDDDDDDEVPLQDKKLHRLVKGFGSNSWSSVAVPFEVSSFVLVSVSLLCGSIERPEQTQDVLLHFRSDKQHVTQSECELITATRCCTFSC